MPHPVAVRRPVKLLLAVGGWDAHVRELLAEVDDQQLEDVLAAPRSARREGRGADPAGFSSRTPRVRPNEDKNTSIRHLRQLFFGSSRKRPRRWSGRKAGSRKAASARDAAAVTDRQAMMRTPTHRTMRPSLKVTAATAPRPTQRRCDSFRALPRPAARPVPTALRNPATRLPRSRHA